MKRWKVPGLLAVAVCTQLVVVAPGPAVAAVTTTGTATFNGTATLPKFPCPPPPPYGTGPCAGTFAGEWTGHVSGMSGTSVFDVAWTTQATQTTTTPPPPSSVSASFVYNEWACLAGSEAGLGSAQGQGTATAGPGKIRGSWHVAGEQLPRDVNGVSLTFTFTWARAGNTAAISLTPVALSLNVSGLGTITIIKTPLQGQASFVPTSSTGTVVPSCGTPLTNVKGLIAGDLTLTGSA